MTSMTTIGKLRFFLSFLQMPMPYAMGYIVEMVFNEEIAKRSFMDAPRWFLRESIQLIISGEVGKFEFFEFVAFPTDF